MMVNRVEITPKAIEIVERLKGQHGALMFHQSGGCCDGSAPMCYPVGDFRVGPQDVFLGKIADCESTSVPPSSNIGGTPSSSSTSCPAAVRASRPKRRRACVS